MSTRFGRWLFASILLLRGKSTYERVRLIRSAFLIALVMIPLVLALIFMDGMMRGITDKYILLQDGHFQVYAREEIDGDLGDIDPTIVSADYVVSGYGIVYSKDATSEVRIKGVDASYFNDRRRGQLTFTDEPFGSETGRLASVILGKVVAERLGVDVGERVAFMVVPDSSAMVVRPVLAVVSSLFTSGYHELDSSLVYMDRTSALRYFPKDKNAYTEVLVQSEASDRLDGIASNVISQSHLDAEYATWDEFNTTVYQNFITSRQVILLVFIMILVVAGVYVASIAQELVQDSMQSIALYKTLGARTGQIGRAFFAAVMVVTVSGMAIGVAIGLLVGSQLGFVMEWLGESGIAGLQYYLLDFPVVVSWSDIIFICFTMLVISSFTVFLSLGRIRRISPLELLQQD
jgi:ABC-type lipoprotein release transport system permease subunit